MAVSIAHNARRRILFVAEAVTLAHVARPRVLANALDPIRYEIHFAAAPTFDVALNGLAAARWPLRSIEPGRFMKALAQGAPIYDRETLDRYVADDLDLLDQVRPDLVIGDFRLSLAISAPLRRIPYFALSNAYWSPFADIARWPIPDLPPARLLGERFTAAVFNWIRPLVFGMHGAALNALRRRHGLTPLGDMRDAYTWGDETLYLDVPQLIPMRLLPPNHHFIGPVVWEPEAPLPEWWGDLTRSRPTLYVTLGSSGPATRLPDLLEGLATLPANIVVATAGRLAPGDLPPGIWGADYLPGSRAARRADLVVSNGGSPTGYQALSEGVPVLGIASNLDQHLAMHHIAAAGAGRLLRSERADPRTLSALVEQMLTTDRYRIAAQRVQGWMSNYRPGERLEERIAARIS